jgi:RNA polymerase sigma-70 factor (ECF subfamily)
MTTPSGSDPPSDAPSRPVPGPFEAWPDGRLLQDESDPAESFAVFYRRHVAAVLRLAAARGVDADAAADVTAETFFSALRSRAGYRPVHDSARLWVLGIAVRRIADHHRSRASERRRFDRLKHEAMTVTEADRHGYERLLDLPDPQALDALADLPPSQQEAIRARVLADRSYSEVAEALGLSEPATRQQVSRGLAAIRRTLRSPR